MPFDNCQIDIAADPLGAALERIELLITDTDDLPEGMAADLIEIRSILGRLTSTAGPIRPSTWIEPA